MEEGQTLESEGDSSPDVVDESRYFVLALADTGWGVWSRGRLTGDPIVMYPPDEDGSNLAKEEFDRRNRSERIRRGPGLGILGWLAILAGVVWIIAAAIYGIKLATALDTANGPGDPFHSIRWWEVAREIAQPLFLVSLGAYVILWLRVRQES